MILFLTNFIGFPFNNINQEIAKRIKLSTNIILAFKPDIL